jgi:hypothetical protein
VTSWAVISGLHRPADDSSRKEVDHCRDIEPALGRPDIREVCDPPLVRPLGGELPIEKVGSDRQRSCAIIFWKPSTSRASAQGVHPHQTLDLVQAAGETFGEHVPPDAARAIGASAPQEARADLYD